MLQDCQKQVISILFYSSQLWSKYSKNAIYRLRVDSQKMIVTHRQARSHWGEIRFALALELEFALVFELEFALVFELEFELEFEFALEFDSHRNSHWGVCFEVWGRSPQPSEARGLRAEPPAHKKFCLFLQKQLNFRAILIKICAFKAWHRNRQCKHD